MLLGLNPEKPKRFAHARVFSQSVLPTSLHQMNLHSSFSFTELTPKTPNTAPSYVNLDNKGTLLARSQFLYSDGKRRYSWKDLNIGYDIDLPGYTIHLFDCDNWTKKYLTEAGIEMNASELKPVDPYMQMKRSCRMEYKSRMNKEQNLGIRDDGKILRFFGLWKNDRLELMILIPITIKLYIVDGTIEIQENSVPNSGRGLFARNMNRDRAHHIRGRGSFMTIVGRQKIHVDREKDIQKLPCYLQARDMDDVTLLTPQHFTTGQDITILGKTFFLSSCDDFTYHYYQQQFGITLPQIELKQRQKDPIPKLVPPRGIGPSDETLQTCFVTCPPKRIYRRTFQKSEEFGSAVLRFLARMDSPRKEDHFRIFILSHFLEDSTVKIIEKSVSGFSSGVFLERCRLRKDGDPPSTAEEAERMFYAVQDFQVGASIKAKGMPFLLIDADVFVTNFMKNHPEIYTGLKESTS